MTHVAGHQFFHMPDGVIGSAVFGGENHCYRYLLTRSWQEDPDPELGGTLCWVMMNPSTATGDVDDATIRKCIAYSRKWRFSGMVVVNTFAYRATDQKRLLEVHDPVGPDNDKYILTAAVECGTVMLAYGTPQDKRLRPRGAEVLKILTQMPNIETRALKLSQNGIPYHPLYLPMDTVPFVLENKS